MYSTFLNIKSEKQEKIIDAALSEFAQKGYDNASTNEIIKNAGISKGLLFHYFKNKKSLFMFLYDYCIDLCMNDYYKKVDLEENDIFLRLKQVFSIKLELIQRYQDIFVFLEVAYSEKSNEVIDDLVLKNQRLIADNYSKIFDNIDTGKFKEGIDIKKAINIIIWTLDGLSAREQKKGRLLSLDREYCEKVFKEAANYIDILKNCFYK